MSEEVIIRNPYWSLAVAARAGYLLGGAFYLTSSSAFSGDERANGDDRRSSGTNLEPAKCRFGLRPHESVG
jgi:hypothetical protein